MGRMIYWMNVSLDLFIGATTDEHGGGDWLRIDEELHQEFNRRAAGLVMMVQGRVIHEIMEQAWPAMAADESLPEFLQEYGRIWMETPKVLVSRARTDAPYNTQVIGDPDAIGRLATLRAETEGDIGVGGAHLATQLLEAELLDEVLLFAHPVVLGSGRPLFDRLQRPLDLELLERADFTNGVTMSRYAVAK